jgi:hypothetical protein
MIRATKAAWICLPTIYSLIDDFALWLRRLWINTRGTQPVTPTPSEGQAFGD